MLQYLKKGVILLAQFTKKAIMDTFVRLLNQYSLDKITVKDIVDECGINRNTFYYYFQDIYAVIDEIFQLETQRILSKEKLYDSWEKGFMETSEFAFKNQRAIYHIYHSLSRDRLENYLYRVLDDLMVDFVYKEAEGLCVEEEDIRFIADFYKYALAGMVFKWLEDGMKENAMDFIQRLSSLFGGSIKMALTKASVSKR